nr:ASKHA domain-containing protein [uncultured Rhodopila sp.]
MPIVTFSPSGASAEIPAGGTLLDAARLARVRLEAPCNGVGTCGKCRVRLDEASRARARIVATRNLSAEQVADGFVLLCSTLADGDLEVTVPGSGERGLRILEDGVRLDLPLNPTLRKRFDAERRCTVVSAGERVLAEEGGDTTTRLYGVAVDIGTTTLVASLLDLGTGARVGSASALNPQVTHAQDVLSRVQIASEPEGLALLHGELMAEIDRSIGLLAAEARIPRRRIYEVVIAGNTCMMHLAAAISPEALGRFPYTPALSGHEHRPAAALGLHIASCGEVYFPPIISGFVGSDITVGVLATDLAAAEGVTLFVDIGTNGEMVLARDGELQATSTAAGPAFEGMNIACGMRAARGAIERVAIERDDIRTATIDEAEAVGICGSGLFDAVAAMAVLGIIDSSGRFTRKAETLPAPLRARLRPLDGKTVFYLDGEIYLSQRDIRQVQLAKAAVRAGIDTMLLRNGLTPAQLDRALVAGSFGYHLTTRSLIDIGLFPAELDGKVSFVGNTARTGAEALLTNDEARETLRLVTSRVEAVELATDPDFTKVFVAAMAFPAPVSPALSDAA